MGVIKRHGQDYIDYYFRGRRRREKVGSSKGEATRALSVRESEIARGKFKLVPKRGVSTFEVFAQRYLSKVSINGRSYNVERYVVRTLNEFFGKLPLCNITAEDAEEYKTKRLDVAKPSTVNRELGVLKRVLETPVEWEILTENVVRTVKYLHVPEHRGRILQREEEIKLLDACNQVRNSLLRPIVVLALHTGMRRRELLALEWSQIDLNNLTIRILHAKAESGKRLVPLSATAYSTVTALAKRTESALVFPSRRKVGSRIVDLKKGFARAIKLAGIPHIRFHDLRHTFATRLAQSNVDLITLKELLGHASIRMTTHYTQSPTEAKMAAVSKLDLAGFCSAPDSNRPSGSSGVLAESEVNSFAAST